MLRAFFFRFVIASFYYIQELVDSCLRTSVCRRAKRERLFDNIWTVSSKLPYKFSNNESFVQSLFSNLIAVPLSSYPFLFAYLNNSSCRINIQRTVSRLGVFLGFLKHHQRVSSFSLSTFSLRFSLFFFRVPRLLFYASLLSRSVLLRAALSFFVVGLSSSLRFLLLPSVRDFLSEPFLVSEFTFVRLYTCIHAQRKLSVK